MLLLLNTSACFCLNHTRNLEPTFKPGPVYSQLTDGWREDVAREEDDRVEVRVGLDRRAEPGSATDRLLEMEIQGDTSGQ